MLKWESQPFVCNIPAGSLLLSSAILFSGLMPNQVLRVLANLACASISTRISGADLGILIGGFFVLATTT